MPRDDTSTDQGDARTPSWGYLDARAHLHVLEMMVQRLYMQLANRTNDPGKFIEQTLTVTLNDIAHFRTPPGMSEAEGEELRRLMVRHADALFHGIRPGR
jgi:hypothetical protein